MAGAERIRMQPVDQIDILDIQTTIQPAPVKCRIFMLAKALKIKRLSVDQKPGILYLDSADTKALFVPILAPGNHCRIQIRFSRPGPPEPGIRNRNLSLFCAGYGLPFCIQNGQPNRQIFLSFAAGLNLIFHNPLRTTDIRYQGNIPDITLRRGIKPYRTRNTGIIEEVKVWKILGTPPSFGVFHTGDARIIRSEKGCTALISNRKCAVVNPVVRRNNQLYPVSRRRKAVKAQLKRKKTAFVFHRQNTI